MRMKEGMRKKKVYLGTYDYGDKRVVWEMKGLEEISEKKEDGDSKAWNVLEEMVDILGWEVDIS